MEKEKINEKVERIFFKLLNRFLFNKVSPPDGFWWISCINYKQDDVDELTLSIHVFEHDDGSNKDVKVPAIVANMAYDKSDAPICYFHKPMYKYLVDKINTASSIIYNELSPDGGIINDANFSTMIKSIMNTIYKPDDGYWWSVHTSIQSDIIEINYCGTNGVPNSFSDNNDDSIINISFTINMNSTTVRYVSGSTPSGELLTFAIYRLLAILNY